MWRCKLDGARNSQRRPPGCIGRDDPFYTLAYANIGALCDPPSSRNTAFGVIVAPSVMALEEIGPEARELPAPL
jgi:hypothetical protein